MTYKEKAEAYDKALKQIKECTPDENGFITIYPQEIFPELKESEDKRILGATIYFISHTPTVPKGTIGKETMLAWLEKQGKHLENYDEAEKEKYDFVSGQYIECRASFNEFKEDNSYWFEYIGNDTYIGRSDNILNQKFHITPRQLYRLFSQQHRPKDDTNEVIENEETCETNAAIGYGKYIDDCLNETAKRFFSEGEDKYTLADVFYKGVSCGKNVS